MTSARLARLTPYIYILPAVLVMLAGLMYPILSAVQLSFYDWSMGTEFDTARVVGLAALRASVDVDGHHGRLRADRGVCRTRAGRGARAVPGEARARHALLPHDL